MNNKAKRARRALQSVGSGDSGQALVETTLSMLILVSLLVGAAEFGQIAFMALEVSNSAKAAVQYGAQNLITATDPAGMQAVAQADASALPSGSNFVVQVSSSCSCSSPYSSTTPFSCTDAADTSCPSGSFIEQTLTVNTSVDFYPVFKLPWSSNKFTLHGQAIQKRLQ
jgi:hypothetical protein